MIQTSPCQYEQKRQLSWGMSAGPATFAHTSKHHSVAAEKWSSQKQQRHPRTTFKKGPFKQHSTPLYHTTFTLLTSAMTRLDRTRTSPHQLRPFFSSQNLLNRADGSAQFDFGELVWPSFFLDSGPKTSTEPTEKPAKDHKEADTRKYFSANRHR